MEMQYQQQSTQSLYRPPAQAAPAQTRQSAPTHTQVQLKAQAPVVETSAPTAAAAPIRPMTAGPAPIQGTMKEHKENYTAMKRAKKDARRMRKQYDYQYHYGDDDSFRYLDNLEKWQDMVTEYEFRKEIRKQNKIDRKYGVSYMMRNGIIGRRYLGRWDYRNSRDLDYENDYAYPGRSAYGWDRARKRVAASRPPQPPQY